MRNVCIAPVNLPSALGALISFALQPHHSWGQKPVKYDAVWLPELVWTFWRRVNVMFMGIEPRSFCSSACTISLSLLSRPGSMFSRNKFLKHFTKIRPAKSKLIQTKENIWRSRYAFSWICDRILKQEQHRQCTLT